ncbi:MAG: OmpA family protein, partial [Myxococcales bacterium]|nr:OmpA family protein [Myxococcales bacterium]
YLDAELDRVLPCAAGLLVAGHTDSRGAVDADYRAGLVLARAVEERLLALGVPRAKITTVSVGAHEPVADDSTPEGRQLNRRVEVTCQAER